MLLERARRHYEQRGYGVEMGSAGTPGLRADLVVEKNGRGRAVRIDDDPLGAYQIGALAAESKRARLGATVICPATPDVIAACEQFGVEHLSPEGLGEDVPIIRAAAPVLQRPTPVIGPSRPLARPVIIASAEKTPPWRWGVVAAIWLAALLAWTFLLLRI